MTKSIAEVREALRVALVAANPGITVHKFPVESIAADCISISDPSIETDANARRVGICTWTIMLYLVRVPQQPVSTRFDEWVQSTMTALANGAQCGFVLLGAEPQTSTEFSVPAYGIVGTTPAAFC